MGFLGDFFNDVVDVAAAPVRLAAKVTDDLIDADTQEWVEETTEAIKVDSE